MLLLLLLLVLLLLVLLHGPPDADALLGKGEGAWHIRWRSGGRGLWGVPVLSVLSMLLLPLVLLRMRSDERILL